jgi:hypothetical protein
VDADKVDGLSELGDAEEGEVSRAPPKSFHNVRLESRQMARGSIFTPALPGNNADSAK